VGQVWIHLNCGRDGCRHSSKHDPADLADRYGSETTWASFVVRCRCPICGHRGARLQISPPHMVDGSDAPRQV